MPSRKIILPFQPGLTYHVYNKGINGNPIFFNESNYYYFLKKYTYYLHNYLKTYAYCLIPNHFHFLISVRDGGEQTPRQVSEQFRRFFISYTHSINKQESRSGNLLIRNVKKIEVSNENYLKQLIFYIHYNPVKHLLRKDFRNYKFSSYKALTSKADTLLARQEVLSWFNYDLSEFLEFHQYLYDDTTIRKFLLEE